jgi:putative addiction module component (TIGR02574 family)
MAKITVSDILELSVPERAQPVKDICDSITLNEDVVPLNDYEKKLIDKRIQEYHKNPSSGSPWEDVKKRILSTK